MCDLPEGTMPLNCDGTLEVILIVANLLVLCVPQFGYNSATKLLRYYNAPSPLTQSAYYSLYLSLRLRITRSGRHTLLPILLPEYIYNLCVYLLNITLKKARYMLLFISN